MGGCPAEVDSTAGRGNVLPRGSSSNKTKMPVSIEPLQMEMELETDWWVREEMVQSSLTSPLDLWHGRSTPVAASVKFQRSSQRCSQGEKKCVTFSLLQIRSYTVVLGDHPCCTMGCPLSLGWEYAEEHPLSIDEYESLKTRRRTRDELRTTREMRREILSNYSDGDVRRVQRQLQRERSCRKKVLDSFFAPPAPPMLTTTTTAYVTPCE